MRGLSLRVLFVQRDALSEDKTILVRNISCLFKTAQMEVERKDNEIRMLRNKLAQQPSVTSPKPRIPTKESQVHRPGPAEMPGQRLVNAPQPPPASPPPIPPPA